MSFIYFFYLFYLFILSFIDNDSRVRGGIALLLLNKSNSIKLKYYEKKKRFDYYHFFVGVVSKCVFPIIKDKAIIIHY